MAVTDYVWSNHFALIGPLRGSEYVSAGKGSSATGAALTFPSREILIGGSSDGNIKVQFADDSTTATVPVKAGYSYPWCVTHIYTLASGGVDAIWAFH